MYYGVHAPWDHSPKFLRFLEIKNPIILVKHFFDARTVEAHEQRLTNWRDHVVNDGYYNDQRFGPGALYHDYELNIRLIESLYLLLLEHEHTAYRKKEVTIEDIIEEKVQWSWYPTALTEKELLNPYLVVTNAFADIKPQEFRDHFVEWLVAALSAQAINEELTASEIFTVYDHLKKLYSAAWVIRQREYDYPLLKKGHSAYEDSGRDEVKNALKVTLSTNKIEQTPAEKFALKEITNGILKIVPSVKAIIHINNISNPEAFMLYLLVDGTKTPINRALNELIEDGLKNLICVITVIESTEILKGISEDNSAFLAYVLAKGVIVYQAEGVIFEVPKVTVPYAKDHIGMSYHQLKLTEASMCFDLIDYRIEEQRAFEAVVLIAQSLRASLQALLFFMTGYKTATPDIERLSWLTTLFTNEIENRFEQLGNLETDLHTHLMGAQTDYDDIPPTLTVEEALQLKIELVHHRMIVKALMTGSDEPFAHVADN
ncbi:HEPN domain-containing protein [Mucilaginibacter sp. SG538B]|uniref:hypothetical protein n=1 Tax=Mucilaginibacter sp. SG538B TaxID=2587021 RepID=UPI00159D6D75|nr:hypothetical protein [Mucilaginibacter sp. SG538B]NVM65066.1 HEPN domain-containing protein [Mucilaginibacter sp. SG538B]